MKMKKLFYLLLLGLTILPLVACSGNAKSSIVLSKIFMAYPTTDNVIELYNPTNSTENLSKYSIGIFTNGANEVKVKINLSGNIAAHSYYAIASNQISSTALKNNVIDHYYIDDQFDFVPFNGNDAIGLFKNNTMIDFVGYKGQNIDYNKDITMIKLGDPDEFKPSTTYNEFDYIAYTNNCFQYLKNSDYEIKTLEQIYAGPHLEDKDFDRPFINPNNTSSGGGGVAKVTTVSSIADGDTANFISSAYGGSTRYFYINTPEVNGGTVKHEPWGYVASKYNKQYLLVEPTTKDIYVQSIYNYALTETYGRHLALVWVNDNLSQFLIVSEGLTEGVSISPSSHDLQMTYRDVLYLTFLRFVEKRAKDNGWGVWGYPNKVDGEKAPDWNWQSNTSTGNSDPVWTPHLALPWS